MIDLWINQANNLSVGQIAFLFILLLATMYLATQIEVDDAQP